jgi:hypothetical protein
VRLGQYVVWCMGPQTCCLARHLRRSWPSWGAAVGLGQAGLSCCNRLRLCHQQLLRGDMRCQLGCNAGCFI